MNFRTLLLFIRIKFYSMKDCAIQIFKSHLFVYMPHSPLVSRTTLRPCRPTTLCYGTVQPTPLRTYILWAHAYRPTSQRPTVLCIFWQSFTSLFWLTMAGLQTYEPTGQLPFSPRPSRTRIYQVRLCPFSTTPICNPTLYGTKYQCQLYAYEAVTCGTCPCPAIWQAYDSPLLATWSTVHLVLRP